MSAAIFYNTKIWQNQASTHIQFYNFEAPQLHVGMYYHAQIFIIIKIWKENANF